LEINDFFRDNAKEINLDIDDTQINSFLKFKDLLLEWNKNINLTAITEDKDVIIKHFIDSLTCCKYIKKGSKVIDVGTGAGFPGLPIKIYFGNDVHVTLMDSLNKRIKFLNCVIEDLGLDGIRTIHSRAEDLGIKNEYREKYNVVVSRAVAHLSVLAEYCLPFVAVGGTFISMKRDEVDEEVERSSKAIDVLGGKVENVEKVKLPYIDVVHSLVRIKKVKSTPKGYPRKAGKPEKEPII